MTLFTDKKALNRKGHVLFSLGLAGFSLYFLKDFITVSFPVIILHLPLYLLGTIAPDFFEPGGKGRIGHQNWIHKSFWSIAGITAIALYFAFNSAKLYFLDIPFNYPSLISAFSIGFETHLGIDRLARI